MFIDLTFSDATINQPNSTTHINLEDSTHSKTHRPTYSHDLDTPGFHGSDLDTQGFRDDSVPKTSDILQRALVNTLNNHEIDNSSATVLQQLHSLQLLNTQSTSMSTQLNEYRGEESEGSKDVREVDELEILEDVGGSMPGSILCSPFFLQLIKTPLCSEMC